MKPWLLLVALLAPSLAHAANPADAAKAKAEAQKKALDDAQSKKVAKVVVIKWKDQPADYTSGALQTNARAAIARGDAKFFPDIDLYQVGRRQPGNVKPGDQPGSVPAATIKEIASAADAAAKIKPEALDEEGWNEKAQELYELSQKIWFIDRPELREPMFKLYAQIGRAAETANNGSPPYYDMVSGRNVNSFFYQAAVLAYAEPKLLDKLKDPDLKSSVQDYKELLDGGRIPLVPLSFKDQGSFDAAAFAAEYEVTLNGLPVKIEDAGGVIKVPPGRTDINMKHVDGTPALSDTVDLSKLNGKVYFVRDVARTKMGVDFAEQLMEHPNECVPTVDGDIQQYIAIYAKQQPDSEVYVVVPEAGNVSRLFIWRWDTKSGTLQKVMNKAAGYPIRFVALGGTGLSFALGAVAYTPANATTDPPTPPTPPSVTPGFAVAGLPFWLQGRAHYNNLMVLGGFKGSYSIGTLKDEAGEDATDENGDPIKLKWTDQFQTGDHELTDADGNLLVNEQAFNKQVYVGIGAMFGKEAALGFGPHGYAQIGWNNLPHTIEPSLHGGLTLKGPFETVGRIKTVLETDLWAGVQIPYGNTVFEDPLVVFGLQAGAGVTF